MVYKLLGKIFRSQDAYAYVAYPAHAMWGLFVMLVGYVAIIRDGWMIFGIITFILGIGLFITVIISINWENVIRYWSTLDQFANTMTKANNPDLWQALGFKTPPSQVLIEERKTDERGNFTGFTMYRPNVSPATMQMIADKVLMSGNSDFIETNYSNVPNFRKIQKQFRKDGLLSQKNNSNPRLGYTFNRKGIDTLYQFASESIKMELKRRENGK